MRYDIGSIINRLSLNDKEFVMWFVEFRFWLKVLIIFSFGVVIYGFKVNLIIFL